MAWQSPKELFSMGRKSVILGVFALVSSGTLVGCGDDGSGPDRLDLSGRYDLVSLTIHGQGTFAPPVATGTFILTESTYDLDVEIALPPPLEMTVQDQGTAASPEAPISTSSWLVLAVPAPASSPSRSPSAG
jgi:hypothetical protein